MKPAYVIGERTISSQLMDSLRAIGSGPQSLESTLLATLSIAVAPLVTSCSSGGSDPITPCTTCTPADLTGTWSVSAMVDAVNGENCNPDAVGQSIPGTLHITHSSPTQFTVRDEDNTTASGTVLGNTAQFSLSMFGATETWAFTVSDDNASLVGELTVSATGCTASGSVSGSRTSTSALAVAEEGRSTGLAKQPHERRHITITEKTDAGWRAVIVQEEAAPPIVSRDGILRALGSIGHP